MSTSSFIAKLDDINIIQISGEQRHEYLHGQLTVSTTNFDNGRARLAAHCDFKGKMFSIAWLSHYQDSFLMASNHEAAKESLTQLKKYGVFSKVEIKFNEEFVCLGLSGSSANIASLTTLFPNLNQQHCSVMSNEFGQVICFNDSNLRYLCYLTSHGMKLLQDNTSLQHFACAQAWHMLEVEAGIANIQGPTIGQFVPQMLNLHHLNAIDFDKGCYMGQEVVARTKYLGKNKRAAFLLHLQNTSNQLPQAKVGDTIETKIGENWRRNGIILRLSTQISEDNTLANVALLAVMSIDTAIGTVARLKDSDSLFVVKQLPYGVDQ